MPYLWLVFKTRLGWCTYGKHQFFPSIAKNPWVCSYTRHAPVCNFTVHIFKLTGQHEEVFLISNSIINSILLSSTFMTYNFVILDEKNLAINDPTKEETGEENNKNLVVVKEYKVETI